MIEAEFYAMSIEQWPLFIALTILCALILFLAIRHVIVGGIFDPLTLTLVAGYSVNYAVIIFLWLVGESSFILTSVILGYGVVMIIIFRLVSCSKNQSGLLRFLSWVTPLRISSQVFYVSLSLYLALSFLIINTIGFGIFSATNRFDVAQGYGPYIRIMDLLSPFIISYSVIAIFINQKFIKLKILMLICFVLYSAMVNGAKISIIFSLCTAFLTLSILTSKIKIRLGTALVGMAIGIVFSVVALSINLSQNNVEESISTSNPIGNSIIVERFVYRLIANGDSSYLLIPNNVIDRIEKDSIAARFMMSLIGVTASSNIFGYPLGDFSVGRQALLYYDPNNNVAGGPTSHFDLFGYVYFGVIGGFLFAVFVGLVLGSINRALRITRDFSAMPTNYFKIAFLATLWTRAVAIIVEPTVGIAYILDIFIFYGCLSLCLQFLRSIRCGKVSSPITSESSNLDSDNHKGI